MRAALSAFFRSFADAFLRPPLRALAWKLTFAFVLVGVLGVALVAALIGQRTRSEFDRFLSSRDQTVLAQALTDYYSAHQSWEGAQAMLATNPGLAYYSRLITLLDAQGNVVIGNWLARRRDPFPQSELREAIALKHNDQVIGYLLPLRWEPPLPDRPAPPEADFIARVLGAAGTSALIAAGFAIVLSVVLARALSQPIRELTAATRAIAGGKLGQRVAVRSRDEIGELAVAFNQMSADLARASQMRKQMTADLAHDLRTPLSILRGYTEGLTEGRLPATPQTFAVMHDEVEHLQRLVEDLRVLSLADAGELPLNRRSVDPAALLERTGLAYIVAAEQQGLALRVEAPEGLPSIHVDTDRMTQVLNNLVSNALRHTQSGEITLKAESAGDTVRLSVRDSGAGIDPADLPYVFDRFYRADKARQRDGDSSGLGLAIAKAIVEAHEGSISVVSAPGQGATFTITLPASKIKPHRQKEHEAQ